MKTYHKINSVFKRDHANDLKTFTDEYCNPFIESLKDVKWYATEKVDGMNIRILWQSGRFELRGKSDNADIPKDLQWYIRNIYNDNMDAWHEKLIAPELCFYGEGFGGKIQSGTETYGADKRFALFDIKVGDHYLEREMVNEIGKACGFLIAKRRYAPLNLEEWVKFIKHEAVRTEFGDGKAEGLVIRPPCELYNNKYGRAILKLKAKDYVN